MLTPDETHAPYADRVPLPLPSRRAHLADDHVRPPPRAARRVSDAPTGAVGSPVSLVATSGSLARTLGAPAFPATRDSGRESTWSLRPFRCSADVDAQRRHYSSAEGSVSNQRWRRSRRPLADIDRPVRHQMGWSGQRSCPTGRRAVLRAREGRWRRAAKGRLGHECGSAAWVDPGLRDCRGSGASGPSVWFLHAPDRAGVAMPQAA